MSKETLNKNLYEWNRTHGIGYADAVISQLLTPDEKKSYTEYKTTRDEELLNETK